MFTDIVGSTNKKGKKMPGAASGERQEAFLRQAKAPHGAIIDGTKA